jgi:glycine hydroxymethyltransferase
MQDQEIAKLIEAEVARQADVVNLIASENYVSDGVRAALGSIFTDKYAEGYPGLRYYGGNEVSDQIENLAKARALALFGLSADEWAVNVQPLSGSPANLAALLALAPLGSKIMGMNLSDGGHLTHGHKVSATGKLWAQVPYGVNPKTETLDYLALEALAAAEKPAVVIAGFTAYPRAVDWAAFRKVADAAGAFLLADMSHTAGLVAGGVTPSPFPWADAVVSTCHKTLRGPRAAIIWSRRDRARSGKPLPELVDKAVFPGLQGGPHINQIAATAVALREAAQPEFKKYSAQVVANARVLAAELARLGWRVISGGTDTHLVLVDTWKNGVGGKDAAERLERAGIIVNKNTIPGETRSPIDPSGIRLGSAAETTRGKTEADFIEIARRIDAALRMA